MDPRTSLYCALWLVMRLLAACGIVLISVYLVCRVKYIMSAHTAEESRSQGTVPDNILPLRFAWSILLLEALALCPNILAYVLRALAVRPQSRPKRRLISGDVPMVDVLITCCREDVNVIMNTVRAACELDYPRDRYRVILCDDGSSTDAQDAVESLQRMYSHVFYTARQQGPLKDYKAGNLNHGIRYSRSLPRAFGDLSIRLDQKGQATLRCRTCQSVRTDPCATDTDFRQSDSGYGDHYKISRYSTEMLIDDDSTEIRLTGTSAASEYVAALDADMIPEPHWLRTILPHLVDDPCMALACPPQTFYDIPVNDPLIQSMWSFASVTAIIHDALNHADCLGSGYVARRSALEGIGGFSTASLAEDVCCSSMLLSAGWKTAFVQEPVQYGSVPESLQAHIKQRTRWFIGHIQTALLLRFRTQSNHLDARQRLTGLFFDLRQIMQLPLALTYFTTPLILLSGYPMVVWTNNEELHVLIHLISMYNICQWVQQGVMGVLAAIGNGWYDPRMPSYDAELDQWLRPYMFVAFLRSFVLPQRLGGALTGFVSSGSIHSDLQERDARARAPLRQRLSVMLLQQWVIVHVLFILACLVGLGLILIRCYTDMKPMTSQGMSYHGASGHQAIICLITRIGWPPVLWSHQVVSAFSPVLYIFFPPTAQHRKALLERNAKTGVAYPRTDARRPRQTRGNAWRSARSVVTNVYTILLLVICHRLEWTPT